MAVALIHPPQKPPVPVPKLPTRPHPPNEHFLSSANQNPSWARRGLGQHCRWAREGKEVKRKGRGTGGRTGCPSERS